MLAVSDCLVVGILHFFGQFRGQRKVLALVKIHQVRNYFPKKSCSTVKLFFFFKYVLYQTVLSKYLKKLGVTVLVSSQTSAKGGHGFEIAVRMENLRGGDWDETQNGAHRVRNLQLNTGIALTCDWQLKIALVTLLSSRDLMITLAFVDENYVSVKNLSFFQIK